MDERVLQAQRSYWNDFFAKGKEPQRSTTHWINVLGEQIPIELAGSVLEIGSGMGYDTRYLLDEGCRVTSLDFSWNALQQVARRLTSAQLVNASLPYPLPFCAESFDVVVAGLSLHYFPWQETLNIIQEIGRVLRPRGLLLFRVNSTEDIAHGAGRGQEMEPNLFYHEGRYKRFFTEEMCRKLFDASWHIERLIPWTETRYGSIKPTWMGVVRRST